MISVVKVKYHFIFVRFGPQPLLPAGKEGIFLVGWLVEVFHCNFLGLGLRFFS